MTTGNLTYAEALLGTFGALALMKITDRIRVEVTPSGQIARRLNQIGMPDAAAFLRRSESLVHQPHFDWTQTTSIHAAVGALEEVACQVAGHPQGRLAKAADDLEKQGTISRQQRDEMVTLYVLRNRTRGVGHGAGHHSEIAARDVLDRCVALIRLLITAQSVTY